MGLSPLKQWVLYSLLWGLTGCTAHQQMEAVKPEMIPSAVKIDPSKLPQMIQERSVEEVTMTESGSLFRHNYSVQLFSDRRAYRVGDILTVNLEGGTKITKNANSAINKNGEIRISDPTLFGRTGASILGSGYSLASTIPAPVRKFSGDTNLSRESKVTEGSVAVQVTGVMPNGTLMVQGESWLMLNDEAELVRISGILRPEDITTDNEVSSKKLAQARVTYSGVGPQGDALKPGWLTRIVNSPWFPF